MQAAWGSFYCSSLVDKTEPFQGQGAVSLLASFFGFYYVSTSTRAARIGPGPFDHAPETHGLSSRVCCPAASLQVLQGLLNLSVAGTLAYTAYK